MLVLFDEESVKVQLREDFAFFRCVCEQLREDFSFKLISELNNRVN